MSNNQKNSKNINDEFKNTRFKILSKANQYNTYAINAIAKMRREERYIYGDDFRKSIYNVKVMLIYIQSNSSKENLRTLYKIKAELTVQLDYIRLFKTQKWIDQKKADYMYDLVTELYKMANGLVAYYKNAAEKEERQRAYEANQNQIKENKEFSKRIYKVLEYTWDKKVMEESGFKQFSEELLKEIKEMHEEIKAQNNEIKKMQEQIKAKNNEIKDKHKETKDETKVKNDEIKGMQEEAKAQNNEVKGIKNKE